jgi:phage terminase large subunit-like protein
MSEPILTAARQYDRHQRDPKAKQFYNSAAWQRCRQNKLAQTPWCERCNAAARHVHHRQPIATPAGWDKRLDAAGLMSLCIGCHNAVEHAARTGETPALPALPAAAGILQPIEDEKFYFDPEAGDRPIRFIEKFCRHYEGQWAGQTLQLLDWQRQLVRTLYGWMRRGEGSAPHPRRRFTEMFLLSAKGAGKTPLLSAIGQYELFAGGEHAAHVVSMATDFKQAQLTQDWAKKSILQDAQLEKLAHLTQWEIRCERTAAKWTTLSGTFAGRAGFRPSCVLADEAWEWPNGKCYESLTANLFKRRQPLVLIATNAGESRECYCWALYEQAKAVLCGTSKRTDLLPAIYEAPEELDWTSEAAARAACPSMPEVIPFASLEPEITKARQSPAEEAKYRRLHLSQWRKSGARQWLDMQLWDEAERSHEERRRKTEVGRQNNPSASFTDNWQLATGNSPGALYIGLDLSEGDDLCSAVFVYVMPERLYVTCRNWLPRQTADEYERAGTATFSEPDVTLLDEVTVNASVRRGIADELIAAHAAHKIDKVCYDAYRADEVVARLTAAGITCVPIRQGFGVSPGCAELERRLKEGSIAIAPNVAMRAAAQHAEIKTDERGNVWPVKPGAKGRYAGTRSIKIDPICALVTALVEARKHDFPAAQKKWTGGVWVV